MSNHDVYLDQISDFIFINKYARYDEKKKRRETWNEAVTRVQNMNLKKYDFLSGTDKGQILEAFQTVREKRVSPSMRSLDNDTLLPTPHGWIRVGDVQVGDFLFDQQGEPVEVLARQQFYGIDLFDVCFEDGTRLRASADHLWVTSTLDDRAKPGRCTRTISTQKIASTLYQRSGSEKYPIRYNHAVWNTQPLALPNAELPLDPYILGLWLGDGYSNGGQFAVHPDDIEIPQSYAEAGFPVKPPAECNIYTWSASKLAPVLRSMGLRNNKHVPVLYLRASLHQRLALVQGLMDSDGHTTPTGRSSFTNASLKLVAAMEELLASLGIKSHTGMTPPKSPKHQTTYTVRFFTELPVHRLQRKLVRQRTRIRRANHYRTIEQVTPAGKGDATCFTVASPTHTYLAGTQMVVTHNCMQFAGPAIESHNSRGYNCAVRHVDSLRAFAEGFWLLLCGCGVTFGLSDTFLSRLPDLVDENDKTGTVLTYVIEDTIEGWADSVEALLSCYFKNTAYTGRKIVFDYSKIRKKGAKLKTSGGKAPGHLGLKQSHIKIKALLDHAIEFLHCKELRSIDAYDILMHCADAVLSGGIRRAATAIIFRPEDTLMLNAKTFLPVDKVLAFDFTEERTVGGYSNKYYNGRIVVEGVKYEVDITEWELDQLRETGKIAWRHIHPQRGRSNNSVLFLRYEITLPQFKEFITKTREFGEPGFVLADHPWVLYNPCFEVGFIPVTVDGVCGVQFCNLTSINGRLIDSKEDFKKAVWAEAVIGTLQAGWTEFAYLSKAAKILTEGEALLGCSITGFYDSPKILLDPKLQAEMAAYAVEVNKEWAAKIGINQAARVTVVKPEGTNSLILRTGSGIHPHHAKKYFRRVQCNKLDPVYKYFQSINPHACEESIWSSNKTDDVITFPITVKDTAIVKADISALQHLKDIKSTQQNWILNGVSEANEKPVQHNVSCTINLKDDEWDEAVEYIYKNRQFFTAVSMLPSYGDKIYQQAPNEAIVSEEDEANWERLIANWTPVDYTLMVENTDGTTLSQEASCAGNNCEVV